MRLWRPWRCAAYARPRRRWGSTNTANNNKAYSDTLLLPKTSFALRPKREQAELPFLEKTSDELYSWQRQNLKGPLFVLHDGPPYANGNLHMGHALNKIIKDIINRFHVLQGHRVNYIPGWDCHGLPIENKALQESKLDLNSVHTKAIRKAAKGVAEREVNAQREQFRQFGIMADWSQQGTYRTLDHNYEIRQLRVFQSMVEKGLIFRHFRPVYYSPSSQSALAEAELVYKESHVSRSVYVLFDLASNGMQTTLKPMLVCSGLAGGKPVRLLVWTTTPWTLTANMAIFVNPTLTYSLNYVAATDSFVIVAQERRHDMIRVLRKDTDTDDVLKEIGTLQGSDLVGLQYHPIFRKFANETFKLLPASYVTADSGSGFVHAAPAHGAEDYYALREHLLLNTPDGIICHVDDKGKFSPKLFDNLQEGDAEALVGLDVINAGVNAVVTLLKEKGAFVKEEKITHRYPYDWKTDKPVIVNATSQWFANLDQIKDLALNALKDVSFFPSISRNRLESFVKSRSEWCISRQRVWGVPIPALHHIPTGNVVLDAQSLDHILRVLEEKGVQHWWDGPVSDFVPPHLLRSPVEEVSQTWRKGTDTMDVWFDSGSSWALLRELGIKSETDGGAHKAYADVCLEGSDQHRGWFQSLLLTQVTSIKPGDGVIRPYANLITHGMVLDEKGNKMSKSLGNVISPLTIINGGKNQVKEPAYGADVLRFWAASVEYWRDMALGRTVLAQAAEALRKVRNSARFILGNIGDIKSRKGLQRVHREDMSMADRYVMHELFKLERLALESYQTFNFPRVVSALSNFANIQLSALYFDIVKDPLYADARDGRRRRSIITVLEQILSTMTHVMAPVVPHLAEEIHWTLHGCEGAKSSGPSFFTNKWEPLSQIWKDEQVESDMQHLLQIRATVLSLLEQARGEKLLRSSLEAQVDIILPDSVDEGNAIATLLLAQENFLKDLFIVSDAGIRDEGSLGAEELPWCFSGSVTLPGSDDDIGIRVRPVSWQKCPRCWTFTRKTDDDLCPRCTDILRPC